MAGLSNARGDQKPETEFCYYGLKLTHMRVLLRDNSTTKVA